MTLIFTNATDRAVFPKRPGVDYAAIAEAAVDDCLNLMLRLATCERRRAYIESRLCDGDRWFLTHDMGHAGWKRALRQQGRLLRSKCREQAFERQAAFDLWHACCSLYVALQHVDSRVTHRIAREIGIATPDHPRAVWDVLTGGRHPPAHWPLEEQDYWIEPTEGNAS